VLAECLAALFRGEDSGEALVGAFRVAEFLNLNYQSLTKKR
jgi:hypothetical protein